MKTRHILAAAAAPATLAAVLLGTAGQASAAVPAQLMAHHQPKAIAVAGVEITTPGYERYAQIEALQGYGHHKGFVNYTNFSVAEPGSGVWAPSGQAGTLAFTVPGGATYDYSLGSGVTLHAASATAVRFSGSGTCPGFTWTIKGEVYRDHGQAEMSYRLIYDPANPSVAKYAVTGRGVISPSDGSASGSAVQTLSGVKTTDLTWTLPAGTFQAVDHFSAPVTADQISVRGQNAIVSFVIPAPAVSTGTPITWQLHNGGKPARDTFKESDNGAPAFAETVEAGHIQILP